MKSREIEVKATVQMWSSVVFVVKFAVLLSARASEGKVCLGPVQLRVEMKGGVTTTYGSSLEFFDRLRATVQSIDSSLRC